MTKKILLIQFRINKATISHERKCFLSVLSKENVKIKIINAFDKRVKFSPKKLKGISGVILGGSGKFSLSKLKKDKKLQKIVKKISPFINHILKNDFPVLGVCFGHHILGYFLGTKIVRDKTQEEIGSFSVFLTREAKSSPLFLRVPKKIVVQEGHKESLKKLPEKAVFLAKGKKCKIQSFRYKGNIYGVQFHPELNSKDLIFRLKISPNYKLKKKLKLSPHSLKIIKNFIKICQLRDKYLC